MTALNGGYLETLEHFLFDCPTVNLFWKMIDKKWKKIICLRGNVPFRLTLKEILLLYLTPGDDNIVFSDNEVEGESLLSLFMTEGVQVIYNCRHDARSTKKPFSADDMYDIWTQSIGKRICCCISWYNNIPSLVINDSLYQEKLKREKYLINTWGFNDMLVHKSDDHNFIIDTYYLFLKHWRTPFTG